MTVTKFPKSATPDQREIRLRKQREAARDRKARAEERNQTYQVQKMLGAFILRADNENKSMCAKCQQVTGTRPGTGYVCRRDRCMVCDAPKSSKWPV